MANSTNNITTQWTFRDGRDYVLSLTTTETPNTVSFWISDKITGEEWTGCYDENGVEVVTKRTGCYKNFHTFLSMIKSAILKKSESVVLDLLNIEDLAVISLQRQNTSAAEEGVRMPPNFQLYNSEINGNSMVGSGSSLLRNGKLHQPADVASGIASNSHKSSLNKRKYLIVTYVGEFDKVHYPFPLNYSNPPDLNVMQNNIIKLKAEVTSLKNAKNELTDQLESLKPGCVPPSSDESKNAAKAHDHNNNLKRSGPNSDLSGDNQAQSSGQDRSSNSIPCANCAQMFASLESKLHDLEDAICFQREEHLLIVEQLETDNHFLRHKVEASEKYELELWNKIQKLKEKVGSKRVRGGDKEMKSDPTKGIHQSRHDLFFNSKNGVRGISSTGNVNDTGNQLARTRSPYMRPTSKPTSALRNRSNSTASYRSSRTVTIDSKNVQQTAQSVRSRSSSYHSIVFKDPSKNRSASVSPARPLFDPTAYVTEKKLKQSRVAHQRLQNIESRIRLASRSQSPQPSPSKRQIQTLSPLIMANRQSPSGENRSQNLSQGKEYNNNRNEDSKSLKERLERRRNDTTTKGQNARPSSAASIPSKSSRFTRNTSRPKNSKGGTGNGVLNKNKMTGDNTPIFKSEIGQRILTRSSAQTHTTTKKLFRRSSPVGGVSTNYSHHFEVESAEKLVHGGAWSLKNDNKNSDIALLQNKLSALQAFLETCKSTG